MASPNEILLKLPSSPQESIAGCAPAAAQMTHVPFLPPTPTDMLWICILYLEP